MERFYRPNTLRAFLYLFVAMLLDGVIAMLFTKQLASYPDMMAPKLLVLVMVMFLIYCSDVKLTISLFIIGFLFDGYYTGILGLYVFILPATAYLVSRIRPYLNQNAFVSGTLFLIVLTFVEVLMFSVFRLINLTNLSYTDFFAHSLGPTLILNLVLFIFCYYPLKILCVKMSQNA